MMIGLLVSLTLVLAALITTGVLYGGAATAESSTSSTVDSIASDAYDAYSEGVVEIDLSDLSSLDADDVEFEDGTLTISAAGVYSLTGTLAGQIEIDTNGKVYLELNGVSVTSTSGPALRVSDAKNVTFILAQDTTNSLTGAATNYISSATLVSNDSLYFTGAGTLYVTSNNGGGISSDDSVIVSNGTLIVQAAGDGIAANDDITINGGDVSVTAGDDGLDSNGTVHINGGQLVAFGGTSLGQGGIDALGDLVITGGTVVVGGNLLAVLSDDSRQTCIYVTSTALCEAGETITLSRDDEEVFSYTPTVPFLNVLISTSDLTSGVMYKASIGAKAANMVMASR